MKNLKAPFVTAISLMLPALTLAQTGTGAEVAEPPSIYSPYVARTVTDSNLNPDHAATYYARVLEIPTPTWQAYDSKFFNIKMPDDVPLSHQERAYTSPIWYTT
jgi:hypothetical protein